MLNPFYRLVSSHCRNSKFIFLVKKLPLGNQFLSKKKLQIGKRSIIFSMEKDALSF